jgi:hypothetical protein
MIAIETNTLVYSHRREVPEHDAAAGDAGAAGAADPPAARSGAGL